MKRLVYIIVLAIAFTACNNEQEEKRADVSVPVSVLEVKKQPIEKYINTTGTVVPVKEVELKALISGKYQLLINPVTGRQFALGDRVKEGQEIVRIDDQEYENNLKLEAQKLNLEVSKQSLEKQKSLYEKGGVTLNDIKKAEIDLVNAEYTYKDAEIRIQKMVVKAPFTGVIVDLPYFTENTKIDAGASVVKMMDYQDLLMDIKLPEKDISQVEIGLPVRVMNYTIQDDTLWGKITQLSPVIDAETRTFKGVIRIDNPSLLLRPGMFVKADIVVASKDSTLVVPKDVILAREKGKVVFVVEKGIARERILAFGLENPEEVEILSGLELNDRLVVKGFETLRDKSKVKVIQ